MEATAPALYLRLDPHSGEPIYRQLVEQVKFRVASGQLSGGAQLPSIRVLAGQLKINPRTVVKAYEELEHAGLVVMRQGLGVFVAAKRDEVPPEVRSRQLAEMARRMLAEASRLGADKDEVLAIVTGVADEMEAQS